MSEPGTVVGYFLLHYLYRSNRQENQDIVLLTDYMYQETEKHNGNILRDVRIEKPLTL